MKKKLLSILLAGTILTVAAKDKQPVIMIVNGEEIPSSEFEYLYKKNKRQQVESQTFEEYLELFKIYRLKVADAKSEGKDTLEAFKKEINQYKRDLITPYIVDSAFIYNYVDIAAMRNRDEVEASHIMLFRTGDLEKDKRSIEILDSLRNEIIKGASFTDIATKYSEDRSVVRNGGYQGYIVEGRFPYAFETAVYETPEGQISEVIDSGIGFHIVKSGKRRPARGKVEVAHILKLVPPNSTLEESDAIKSTIDSLYSVVFANPDLFSEVATAYSEDPGSAINGGKLPFFGPGEMVPEFEQTSYELSIGEISKPIRTSYGWHIIKKIGAKSSKEYSEIRNEVLNRVNNPKDPRYKEIENHNYDLLRAKFGRDLSNNELLEAEENWQYLNNEDYRNLINEYTDGSMLYEVSLDKVWNKAMQDTEGLENYFKNNREKYKWEVPYAKGFLVQVKSDSIGNVIRQHCLQLNEDSIVKYIRKNYPGEALVEKFFVVKGNNPMVDNILFNGPVVKPKAKNFKSYLILEGRVLEEPEELNDVRGAVTSDYQDALEQQWVADLKNKYKIIINKKELSRLQKRLKKE